MNIRVGILALQGDFAAHARRLEQLGLRPENGAPPGAPTGAIRLVRDAGGLEGIDALILPGGESTTMLRLLGEGEFFAALQAAVRRIPVLATCAGTILLARNVAHPPQRSLAALELTALRNAYGRQLESRIARAEVAPEFSGELGAATLEAVLIRAPQLLDLSPAVRVVAAHAGRPLLVLQDQILASSFHPELARETCVHAWFLQRVARWRHPV